ncbi:MAG: Rap1a/Tai family immunity protein [Acidobacteriota bacterium]
MKKFIGGFVLLLVAAQSRAQARGFIYVNGNALAKQAAAFDKVFELGGRIREGQSSQTQFFAGLFMGYVSAVADTLREKVCKPAEVSAGQAASVVSKYLKDHPEALHYAANEIVDVALKEAFPCSEK